MPRPRCAGHLRERAPQRGGCGGWANPSQPPPRPHAQATAGVGEGGGSPPPRGGGGLLEGVDCNTDGAGGGGGEQRPCAPATRQPMPGQSKTDVGPGAQTPRTPPPATSCAGGGGSQQGRARGALQAAPARTRAPHPCPLPHRRRACIRAHPAFSLASATSFAHPHPPSRPPIPSTPSSAPSPHVHVVLWGGGVRVLVVRLSAVVLLCTARPSSPTSFA